MLDCIPKRWIVVILMAVGMMLVHGMRTNIGITMVMVLDIKPHEKVGTAEAVVNLPHLDWTAAQVGVLQGIFYVGYFLAHIPAAYLATILTSYRMFGGSVLLTSSLNLLLPVTMTKGGYDATCILRFLQGMTEGVLYPTMYDILRHWSTSEERGRLGSFVLTGVYAGAIVAFPMAGFLEHYAGWQHIYYLCGGLGIFWYLWWLFLVYKNPQEHPYIKESEIKIMESSKEDSQTYIGETIPWKEILQSYPVYALCICYFARSWIFYLLLTMEPLYLNTFGFTIFWNGILSAIPHAVMVIVSFLSGFVADYLMRDTMLSSTDVRRLLTCIGFGTEAVCIFFLTFLENSIMCMVFLSIGIGFSGFTIAGWQINHLDLAPRYAGVLGGISSEFGSVAAILAPIVAGYLTRDQTLEEWHIVWAVTGLILTFAAVFYGVFGSAEKQPWAEPPAHLKLYTNNRFDPLVSAPYKKVGIQTEPSEHETIELKSESPKQTYHSTDTTPNKYTQDSDNKNTYSDTDRKKTNQIEEGPALSVENAQGVDLSEDESDKRLDDVRDTTDRDSILDDGGLKKRHT